MGQDGRLFLRGTFPKRPGEFRSAICPQGLKTLYKIVLGVFWRTILDHFRDEYPHPRLAGPGAVRFRDDRLRQFAQQYAILIKYLKIRRFIKLKNFYSCKRDRRTAYEKGKPPDRSSTLHLLGFRCKLIFLRDFFVEKIKEQWIAFGYILFFALSSFAYCGAIFIARIATIHYPALISFLLTRPFAARPLKKSVYTTTT
jgi:hypothetical protein